MICEVIIYVALGMLIGGFSPYNINERGFWSVSFPISMIIGTLMGIIDQIG